VKLSHDPNNTKWTRDTGGFGHKIMTAQGWTPGEYLGAKDAAHADFFTAANASHIRVLVKDDNLGLGAKKGSGLAEGECTGLDVFQTILGRLNGRDEDEMEKEQRSREDLKRAIYTEKRWGSIRFVPGGFLIGDKIEKLIDDEAERLRVLKVKEGNDDSDSSDSSESEAEEVAQTPAAKEKKSKKERQSESKPDKAERAAAKALAKEEKRALKKKRKASAAVEEEGSDEETEKSSKKRRKDQETSSETAATETKEERRVRRAAKKEKKEKKRKEKGISSISLPTSTSASASATPTSQPGTPISMMSGRHAVRSRNIAQKRLAVMDMASLNQVCANSSDLFLPCHVPRCRSHNFPTTHLLTIYPF
jgi:Pin2-interacting protein X1